MRLPSSALARSRKPRRGTELVCEWVFRPLAHPLVLLFARLRVPPPVVVVAAGAAGIAAAIELGRGSLVVAALLVQLKTLLDNADGQLARLTGRTSAFGRYLDSEVDLLVNAALFAGLGWTTGQPFAGARRLPRAHKRSQPQLQRRAAVASADVAKPEAAGGRATRGLRRIYGARVRAAGPARGGDRRAAAGARRARAAVSAARQPWNVDPARRVRTPDRARASTRLRLGRSGGGRVAIALALLTRRAPSRQEEIA